VDEALLAEIKAQRLRLPDRGWATQTFIHAADAARALQAAAGRGRPGGVYVAAGFTDTWHDLCVDLAASCGVPFRIGTVPYGLAYALAAARELLSQPGARCFPSRELVDMFARPRVVDDSISRRELTWSPQVGSFEEGRQYLPPHRRRDGGEVTAVTPATSRRGRSRS
jgi:nucleoside-diphosphate-sugar epimerase